VTIGKAGGCANAHALTKQFDDLDDFFVLKPQITQRLQAKGFVAPDAAITLDDAVFVFELAKLLSFAIAA
jgi:hypothetical protein